MANQQSGEPNGQVKNEGMKAAQTLEDETLNDNEEDEDFSVAGVNDEKSKQKNSNVTGGQGTMGNNQNNITQQPSGA